MKSPRRLALAQNCALLSLVCCLGLQSARAGSATWNVNPTSSDWNTATNWTPATVPNDPSDTASFNVSNLTSVSLSGTAEVDSVVFSSQSSPFTITCAPLVQLMVNGTGIVNNSASAQNFVAQTIDGQFGSGIFDFYNNASAGTSTVFLNEGAATGAIGGGTEQFLDNSTAGSATFMSEGGQRLGSSGGEVAFYDNASAGDGTFINNGAADLGAIGATILFQNNSTAGNGVFTNNGASNSGTGGEVSFFSQATAGSGTFTNNGGVSSGSRGGLIFFSEDSSGGSATFINNGGTAPGAAGGDLAFYITSAGNAGTATLIANGGVGGGAGGTIRFAASASGSMACAKAYGNGSFDVSGVDIRATEIGSFEGDGDVFLGRTALTTGGNDRDTVFSGVIQEGGAAGGKGGSLIKVGNGALTLSGANLYRGGTTLNGGAVIVGNTSGSATGIGIVSVNTGTLGGGGIIAGAVTVGTGSGTGATLQPSFGTAKKVALTIQSLLTFKTDATYTFRLKSKAAEVIAKGVTIESGAQFNLVAPNRTLPAGKTATVISNTAATPISGTFANLPDGGTSTAGSNTFQASYEGGDGNDLTLTVAP